MKLMNELSLNEDAVVRELSCRGALRRRFLDIGIFRGARVKKVSVSPLGDPSCYLINGTMVAIRKCDASKICIE